MCLPSIHLFNLYFQRTIKQIVTKYIQFKRKLIYFVEYYYIYNAMIKIKALKWTYDILKMSFDFHMHLLNSKNYINVPFILRLDILNYHYCQFTI